MKKHSLNFLIALIAALTLTNSSLTFAQDEEDYSASSEDQPVAENSSVEVTVGELEELLNLPDEASLRKEYQEDLQNPPNIFTDDETIRRIFGDKPRFVYLPEGVDPMIIPWVRDQIIAEELLEESTIAVANNDFDKALEILRTIRENYPGTESSQKTPDEINRVTRLKEIYIASQNAGNEEPEEVVALPAQPEENEVVLPQWVRRNTNGILMVNEPVVIVGNDFLQAGDVVPRYSTVKVKSVDSSEVVYTYQDKDFIVEVVGSF